jgi:hypothetical protein
VTACAFLALLLLPAGASAAVGWSAAAPMSVPRAQQSSTLLPDGKVLVAGGYDGFAEGRGGVHVSLASAELFDQATGSWSPTAPMGVGRSAQTATLLGDGEVLVVGGWEEPGNASRTAEVFDPSTGGWSPVAPPPELQLADTATLLGDGDVLVTGLFGAQEYGATIGAAEFLPASGTWVTVAAPPAGAERDRTAVALPGGGVLLAGGVSGDLVLPGHQTAYRDAEIFEPAAGTWTPAAPLGVARLSPTATPLPGGQVLFTGGLTEVSPAGSVAALQSTEAFDPGTDTWAPRAPMHFARGKDTASALPGGDVLVAGGSPCSPAACLGAGAGPGCCAAYTAEVYDPIADAWTATEPVLTLAEHAASVLPGGSVLVSGGNQDFGDTHETGAAEIYGNLPPPAPPANSAGPAPTPPRLKLSGLRQSHRRWREPGRADGTTRGAGRVGTTFSFDLDDPAGVTLRFRGVDADAEGGCKSPVGAGRHPGCGRAPTSGGLRIRGNPGPNRVAFAGRVGPGRLAPGSYTVTAVARTAAGTSTSATLAFRILGPTEPRRAAHRRVR